MTGPDPEAPASAARPDGPAPAASASGPPRSGRRLAQEKAYVRAIERRFVALRGSGMYLSPGDFPLLLDWHERGVPVDLVIATIEDLFEKSAARSKSRTIQSLRYCRRAIEDAWERRRTALLGPPATPGSIDRGSAPFSPQDVAGHLRRAHDRTRDAAQRLRTLCSGDIDAVRSLDAVVERLAHLAGEQAMHARQDLAPLEDELVRLEEEAVQCVAGALAEARVAELRREAERSLDGFTGRMSARVRESTIARSLSAALRRTAGLPRFSLFAMSASSPPEDKADS